MRNRKENFNKVIRLVEKKNRLEVDCNIEESEGEF